MRGAARRRASAIVELTARRSTAARKRTPQTDSQASALRRASAIDEHDKKAANTTGAAWTDFGLGRGQAARGFSDRGSDASDAAVLGRVALVPKRRALAVRLLAVGGRYGGLAPCPQKPPLNQPPPPPEALRPLCRAAALSNVRANATREAWLPCAAQDNGACDCPARREGAMPRGVAC